MAKLQGNSKLAGSVSQPDFVVIFAPALIAWLASLLTAIYGSNYSELPEPG